MSEPTAATTGAHLANFLAGLPSRSAPPPAVGRGVSEDADGGISASIARVGDLRTALQRVPADLQSGVRRGLRLASAPIVADAKRRASWSSRIPQAIGSRTSFSGNRAGVRIAVSAKRAPHARPYEGLVARARDARRIGFRHPVFASDGNRRTWTWINQPFRPFLQPAVEAGTPTVERSLLAAVDDALRRNGF